MISIMMMKTQWWTNWMSFSRTWKQANLMKIWGLGRAHFLEVSTNYTPSLANHWIPILEWIRSSYDKRKAHVELLLEGLEHKDAITRFTNARRLFYVLQGKTVFSLSWVPFSQKPIGTFGETGSPEHQLHWIFENCRTVRGANGISTIMEAIKLANSKHDILMYCCTISIF